MSGTALAMYVEETYSQFHAPSPRSILSREEVQRYGREGASMGLDEVVAYALDRTARFEPAGRS